MTKGKNERPLVSSGRKLSGGRIVADLANVTWRMLLPVVLGIAGGYYFDNAVGSKPAGFLVGALAGFAVGLWMAIRLLRIVKEEEGDV